MVRVGIIGVLGGYGKFMIRNGHSGQTTDEHT